MLLTTKRYDANDIVTLKLVNGDEVVAKIKQDTNDEFVVTKPCAVLPSAKGLGLVQCMFSADTEVEIHIARSHVMMHAPSMKDMRDYYTEVVSGIKPATASGIIT